MSELTLIRHGEVEGCWKKICYGAMDVPLSSAGRQASRQLAANLAAGPPPQLIFHSDLMRTRFLAEQIAASWQSEIPVIADTRLRERDFGQWQGLTWDEAYASDPEHFQDLIDRPDTYRPPDGETTSAMQSRIVSWYQENIATSEDTSGSNIIAISHSGPIAALAGWMTATPANQWTPWLLKPLEAIFLPSSATVPRIHSRSAIDMGIHSQTEQDSPHVQRAWR